MAYITENSKIIADCDNFDIIDTLTCGQLFRYRIDGDKATIFSMNHKACLTKKCDKIVIDCDDTNYWVNYFDLDTDYSSIVDSLKSNLDLAEAIEYGKGIRILKQDLFETIISFIISANNNIPRIKMIIEKICVNYGTKLDEYHAFPTVQQLVKCTATEFRKFGAGFRSEYLEYTIGILSNTNFLDEIVNLETDEAIQKLLTLKGVGPKVADCILLFGLGRTDSYPVDTWIFKSNVTDELNTKDKIRRHFVDKYGSYAGYVQQYIFYYSRDKQNKDKNK